ncbi:MAG TPA: ornithine cyclodeaminase family protein [Gemmatimonadaceae bacterium]|jgi:ornithine cyclodeaminase|nr:ornithine cyclodeaminase family protein [Gemmatimonadaceae bacterium]
MLIIDQGTVERLLPMATCIGLMRSTLSALARGETILPLRTILVIPDGAFAVMPAYLASPPTIGAKIITVFPKNHGTAFDSHQGAVLLFDADNGSLAAIMDATSVTTIRTAAVSGVATEVLARDDATSLAILGAGVQGHSHLEAMCAVRPLKTLRVWSRSSEHAERLADVARDRFGLQATVTRTAEEAVRRSDIVCTTTSATEPILLGEWLSPGTHVNAVGASQPHAREIDTRAVVRSRLYADRRESALKEPGDILIPLQDGEITPDHIVGEVGEVLIGRAPARAGRDEITLFKSLGLAIEDLASASHVFAEAKRQNAGVEVALGGARSAAH